MYNNPPPKAKRWFANIKDFQQLCLDAKGNAHSEAAEDFTHDMLLQANEHGLESFLSERQLKWLCALADLEMPKPRALV